MSRIPVEPVPDALMLAAVERAERHRDSGAQGVLWREVVTHLGFDHVAWTTRRLAPQRDALLSAGLVARKHRYGLVMWALTGAGRRSLGQARSAGELGELPESPQHQRWQEAHEAAADRIGDFRGQLCGALAQADGLLATKGVSSDAWFELGERLERICWTLASATYCLCEWREPDDAHADIDDHSTPSDESLQPDERDRRRYRRKGRRDIHKWGRGWRSR
jgi:hypothetical protein